MDALNNDPDIRDEAEALSTLSLGQTAKTLDPSAPSLYALVALNVVRNSHQPSRQTIAILTDAGGLPALRRFTAAFYEKTFLDPHLDKLIRE